MAAVHILLPDQSQRVYEDFEIPDLLREGTLTPETYFWKEGMPEWRTLNEWVAAPVPSPNPTAGPLPQNPHSPIKNLEPLATIARVMLGLYLVVSIVYLYCAVGQMQFAYATPFDREAARAHDLLMRIISLISLGVYVLTSIPFLMWVYRANRNCRAFAPGLRFSSGMAVGSYFIPIANLVYPCQVMQEIWKVSTDPANWKSVKNSVLVGFWWTFWLLTGFTGYALLYLSKVHDRASLRHATSCLMALETSKIILSILAFTVIHKITARQTALLRTTRSPIIPS